MIDWAKVGSRIRALRKSKQLSQQQFGELVGVSYAAISNWERGIDLSMNRVFDIITALSLPADSLLSDRGLLEQNENSETVKIEQLRGRVMPKYSFEQALMPEQSRLFVDHIRSHFPCSENSFALTISDRANAEKYLPGDSVVIDMDVVPEPEDMVFAYVGAERKPVFRLYEVSERAFYTLKALNSSHRSYRIGPDHEEADIIGVMTEHVSPRRQGS